MKASHSDFSIKQCGFYVHTEVPYLGASPDGVVECSCCGAGVVEIKCPWCAKNANSLQEVAQSKKNFCLQNEDEAGLKLSKQHSFYLQCQLQMHVTRRTYCDFIVWREGDIHIERIKPDPNLLQPALQKAEQFFKLSILPEIVGKWFTRSHIPLPPAQVSDIDEEDRGVWCYCQESKGGDMIGCDNKSCPIKWFHLICLSMKAVPTGKWLCPTCHLQKKKK